MPNLCIFGYKRGCTGTGKTQNLRLPDNEKDGRFVERPCRFTGRLHASPFPHKQANMSCFMTIHLQANKKAGSLGWASSLASQGYQFLLFACRCMVIKQLMLASLCGKRLAWSRPVKRQRRSTKRPSFPLSGTRKILSFARTGTPLLYPNMPMFGAVRNNCYFKRPLHLGLSAVRPFYNSSDGLEDFPLAKVPTPSH